MILIQFHFMFNVGQQDSMRNLSRGNSKQEGGRLFVILGFV